MCHLYHGYVSHNQRVTLGLVVYPLPSENSAHPTEPKNYRKLGLAPSSKRSTSTPGLAHLGAKQTGAPRYLLVNQHTYGIDPTTWWWWFCVSEINYQEVNLDTKALHKPQKNSHLQRQLFTTPKSHKHDLPGAAREGDRVPSSQTSRTPKWLAMSKW